MVSRGKVVGWIGVGEFTHYFGIIGVVCGMVVTFELRVITPNNQGNQENQRKLSDFRGANYQKINFFQHCVCVRRASNSSERGVWLGCGSYQVECARNWGDDCDHDGCDHGVSCMHANRKIVPHIIACVRFIKCLKTTWVAGA